MGRPKWLGSLVNHWQQLALRDRQMLTVLCAFLIGVALYKAGWQPTQQRLENAERIFQQRLSLAREISSARAVPPLKFSQPMAHQVSESAASAGLELLQLESDSHRLQATLAGDAAALVGWLIRVEHEGARMQSLTLQKQDNRLLVSVAWAAD